MMPLRWKIFLALNFLLALPAIILLGLLLFVAAWSYGTDYGMVILFSLGLFILTINGFLNISFMQRYFPDRLIPRLARRIHLVSLVLTGIADLGILVLCVFGAREEFKPGNQDSDYTGKVILGAFALAFILQLVVLWWQGKLPGLIRDNNERRMQSLIDEIGR